MIWLIFVICLVVLGYFMDSITYDNRFATKIKQLSCKHKYKRIIDLAGYINCPDGSTVFKCEKCGKIKLI